MKKQRTESKVKPLMITFGFIFIVILIVLLVEAVQRFTPSKEVEDLRTYYGIEQDDDVAIIQDNEKQETKGKYIDGTVYLMYDTVHDDYNSRFYWDNNENILLYTKPEGMVKAELGAAEYTVGKETVAAEHPPVRSVGEQVYVALDFVQQYTDMKTEYYDNPHRIVLTTKFDNQKQAVVEKATQIRVRGGIKSPILRELKEQDTVVVLEQGEDWNHVATADGVTGYMKKKYCSALTEVAQEHTFEEDVYPKNKMDTKVNLVWHQVTEASANAGIQKLLAGTKGVNVVSPTWFYLNDNEGNIGSLADRSYVDYCHQSKVKVWGLLSNLVNTDVDTAAVLTYTSRRMNLVNQIVAAAIQYDLDGINVDIETVPKEVGDGYVQFIRELSLKCANNGLTLSVDNYVPSEYTAFYRRAEQAVFADYIIVMGYDEHYVGSEEGSTASIGFVCQGVQDTLEEVPADQVILGMPFYTRLWSLKSNERTSQAMGMREAENIVKVNGAQPVWQEDLGQYYAEYQNQDVTYKIWLETQESLDLKLKVMSEQSLAGAAFWKLGLEKTEIWDTIIKYMN